MADHLTIRRITNRDPDFYPLIGPFLARRTVVKELGGHVWDDDDKTWWVALRDRAVVGFAAARDDGRRVTFQSAYVLPGNRRQGVYRELFLARMREYSGRPVRAVCTASSLPTFLGHGFTPIRDRGRYVEVQTVSASVDLDPDGVGRGHEKGL